MVYRPSAYLVTAAVALLVTRMQQAAASSMFYGAEPAVEVDKMSSDFPGRGMDMPAEALAYVVTKDPTLPNIESIPKVPAKFPELLASNPSRPVDSIFAKVGTPILSRTRLQQGANQDSYIADILSMPVTLPAIVATTPLLDLVHDAVNTSNCEPGWEEEPKPDAKGPAKRRLEEFASARALAKLEAHFGRPMETKLANLPNEGAKERAPWPGPYWPKYQDCINVDYRDNDVSATEKYATAFGLDVITMMDIISRDLGVESSPLKSECEKNSFCEQRHGENVVCAKRQKPSTNTQGLCTAMWTGICHAWCPAAILEEEPRCPVTYNGVVFYPVDIKALLTVFYDGSRVPIIYAGARYYKQTDSKDKYGRHTNVAYRDINPGIFHIATANIVGISRESYVVDKEAGREVWNQPVRGYKVYDQIDLTLEEAAQYFYGLETYPWNAAAKSLAYINMRLSWIDESYEDGSLVMSGRVDNFTSGADYTYLLELDGEGNIIGGEWVYESHDNHPDFIWFPQSKPALDAVIKSGVNYSEVEMLLEKSIACTSL
uniref:Transglutaminase elicitor n=1 Tax=Hyaloperonospora arabidopsidis (strain Emoy2) TaxID=559515 RepID=M4BQC3_HYAAE